MKDLEFLGVGLRLLGIACIVYAISKTGEGINAIHQLGMVDIGLNSSAYKAAVWLPVIIIYLIGFLFIKFPITFAKMLLPRSSANSDIIEFSQRAIVTSGLTLLGAYLLAIALPDLAYNILFWYQQRNLHLSENPEITQTFIHLVFTLIQLGLGLFLLLGGKGIYKLIHRLRG